jgi:hypothetical protein
VGLDPMGSASDFFSVCVSFPVLNIPLFRAPRGALFSSCISLSVRCNIRVIAPSLSLLFVPIISSHNSFIACSLFFVFYIAYSIFYTLLLFSVSLIYVVVTLEVL